jgi:hypothetical protein
MKTYQIRFNKTRGQEGRGTVDHVWRVFEDGKEYLFKHLNITVPVKSQHDENGIDYNITCQGELVIDRVTSTAHICASVPKKETAEAVGPEVKIICVSNVFSRLMHFKQKGNVEFGHKHTYDHGTLVSSGSVLYEVLDDFDGKTVSSKVFKAPDFVYVDKDKHHKLTALEDDTVCACIHALKTNDQELLSPDFLIEPLVGDQKGIIGKTVAKETGMQWLNPAKIPRIDLTH